MALPSNLTQLTKLLEKNEPKVLVVVGAGISMGATGIPHASWAGLIEHGIKYLVQTSRLPESYGNTLIGFLQNAFNPFNLELALKHANNVEESLSFPESQAFADWLEIAFRDFKPLTGRDETLNALRNLQQAGALLMTTNYDNLLSDVTELPPVTWEAPDNFLQVINRQRDGILHIHGHWQKPSSVVLGKSSYERVVEDEKIQAAFKSLWLEWSWIYVGCGDGLDDPNLGRLLEWGKKWEHGPLDHYFLTTEEKAFALKNRPDKPKNIVYVGFSDFSDLPKILNSITPTARCFPFVLIDEDFPLFRSPSSKPNNVPFPSLQEYLNGDVPSLKADAVVHKRLQEHGWAFVLDLASVGKTTLALRIATRSEQTGYPVFYLDLADIKFDSDTEEMDIEAIIALKRLTRPNTLFIIDNTHHQPELARKLWDCWKDIPRDSRLLLIGTRMQRTVITSPAQDSSFFEEYPDNPAVVLRLIPEDLKHIAQSIHKRFIPNAATWIEPPESVLSQWHQTFGSALNAFCLAVLDRLHKFIKGNWELPPEAAANWVREKWLKKLDEYHLENLICLSVFASQELEIAIPCMALPFPNETDKLLHLGLAARVETGLYGENKSFRLREPGWGSLILAAQPHAINKEMVLLTAAKHHLPTATTLCQRFRQEENLYLRNMLLTLLASDFVTISKLVSELSLLNFLALVREARLGQQYQLIDQCWQVVESEPDKLNKYIWELPLQQASIFFNAAKQDGRNTKTLWQVMNVTPEKFAERAWSSPLCFVGYFLKSARWRGQVTAPLWQALESEPDKLNTLIGESFLEDVGHFLVEAKKQGRNVDLLWQGIEDHPEKFTMRTWETKLRGVEVIHRAAKWHNRDIKSLWQALKREPDWLISFTNEQSLDDAISILEKARTIALDTIPIWQAIEAREEELTAYLRKSSLAQVIRLLKFAQQDRRNVKSIWAIIENSPDKLVGQLWSESLAQIISFLNFCRECGFDTSLFWQAMENSPDKLVGRLCSESLAQIVRFLNFCRECGFDTSLFWQAIEDEPSRIDDSFWNTDFKMAVHFMSLVESRNNKYIHYLRRKKQVEVIEDNLLESLWKTIADKPMKLAIFMAKSEGDKKFFSLIEERGINLDPIWSTIENEPRDLIKHVSGNPSPLTIIGNLINIAMIRGRNVQPLWHELELEAQNANESKIITQTRLSTLLSLLKISRDCKLSSGILWEILEREGTELIAIALKTPNSLQSIRNLLVFTKEDSRNAEPLWTIFTNNLEEIADQLSDELLPEISKFLVEANECSLKVSLIWEKMAKLKIADRMRISSLKHRIEFFSIAKQHGLNILPLWEALEGTEVISADEHLKKVSCKHSSRIKNTTLQREQEIEKLWQLLERDPKHFADQVWKTTLENINSYQGTAKKQGRNTEPMWRVLESNPIAFAELAWESHLKDVITVLNTAKAQGCNTEPLWQALESNPAKLAVRTSEATLETLASFLNSAKRHNRNAAILWQAITHNSAALALQTWKAKLESIELFIKSAAQHEINTDTLWEALIQEPEKLAARIWATSPGRAITFLKIINHQGHTTEPVWQAFEDRPERLLELVKSTPLFSLGDFCLLAGNTFTQKVLDLLPNSYWEELEKAPSMFMIGATRLVGLCKNVGREDHKTSLVTVMLRRASSYDFPSNQRGLIGVTCLLENSDSNNSSLVPTFLDRLFANNWLSLQFLKASPGSLADGLRRLALYQPTEVMKRFLNIDLDTRLHRECAQFVQVARNQQSAIIQLLGCASLCGWSTKADLFEKVPLSQLSKLPIEVLPHRPEAIKVEEWQFQLWLGLRVVAMSTGKQLNIEIDLIKYTLELWRVNLKESAQNEDSAEHKVNLEMVQWLELCASN